MNNFIFENATKTFFGKGCVNEYLACLSGHYGNTVMLCYGGGSIKKNGVYDDVMACLQKAGKTVIEFPGIMANPTYAKVLEGAKLARENKVGLLLGVGGGSVMDCCKAISMAAVYDGDIWADFWARPGVIDFEPLPLGVIVTVAGTGSEMNGGAVITNEALKVKTGRDYPKCNPKFALMDPTYTYSVPKQQLVSGGFDILSHIMETYFSEPNEENVSDDISEALMRGVIRDLRASIKNPQDYTARTDPNVPIEEVAGVMAIQNRYSMMARWHEVLFPVLEKFTAEAMDQNQKLLALLQDMAREKNATPAQLSLAWMLCKKPWIVPIPGTRKLEQLRENAGAADVVLTPSEVSALDDALDTIPMSEVFGGSRIVKKC